MARDKDEERILKAARDNQLVVHKGTPISINDFSGKRSGRIASTEIKIKNPATKNKSTSKAIIQI